MAGRIVVIGQQKGGSGKSTLGATLATCWAGEGRRVTLVDIDPQGSIAAWGRLRERAGVERDLEVIACPGWRLPGVIDKAEGDVIVDSPPHAESEARAAIRQADLALIPCQPSPLDIWASAPTMEFAEKEDRSAALVLTRVPPRGKMVEEARKALAELAAPRLETEIGSRQDFVKAMARGLGVIELAPSSRAADEARALACEVASKLEAR